MGAEPDKKTPTLLAGKAPGSTAQLHLPAIALVSPGMAWEKFSGTSSWLGPFVYQVILLFASWLIGSGALRDMAVFSGFGYKFGINIFSVAFTVVQSAAAALAVNALVAFLLGLALRLQGTKVAFRQLFLFTLVSLLPFVVGLLIGSINLFFQRPLSNDVLVVVATYLKPYSLGLASFFPGKFPLLTLPWFLASYFDLFGLWSILVAYMGFRHFFRFEAQRALWATISLMLVLILLVTLLWQAIQAGLSSTLA